MRKFKPEPLHRIGCSLFEAAGVTAADASTVVDHLVESSLFGHDSHGTIRFYEYVNKILDGDFNPQGRPDIVRAHGSTAVVDGGGALGQVGANLAIDLAVEKAREYGVGAVSLRNTCHIGRIGAYPLKAARQGFLGLACVNAGRLGYQIAPFGGIDGKISTNPLAFAAPRPDSEPFLMDITTSITAEGKIRLARNRGQRLPEGWIIDQEGRPSTDPEVMYGEKIGAILPLGGPSGHKGYAMGLQMEIMGGILSEEGCANGSRIFTSNGVLFTVYDPLSFIDQETYDREMKDLVSHVKSSRLQTGFDEILIPGELEFRNAAKRSEEGIPIDDKTWEQIGEVARKVGLDPQPWEGEAVGKAR